MDEISVRELFRNSHDVQISAMTIQREESPLHLLLVYCSGLADVKQLNDYVLHHLQRMIETHSDIRNLNQYGPLRLQSVSSSPTADLLTAAVFEGSLVVFITDAEEQKLCYKLDIGNAPKRNPEESSTEVAVKGARDGFTEDITTNIALIRKRLRTASLCCEMTTVGRRSQSKVALLYVNDITDPALVEEARKRIAAITIDALNNSNQLESALADRPLSIFPQLDYVGRPDYVTEALMVGRMVILAEGSPNAIIAPVSLLSMLKTPEDLYLPYYFVSIERILRFVGFFVAVFLPGFWIALTSFNMDQLPFTLLATVAMARSGLPLPSTLEVYLVVILFELFREAGVRLPKTVGQTVAVVGGLIIGEMAVAAGITAPTMIVVVSVSTIAAFTLVNQSLNGTVTLLRFFVLTLTTLLGMFGFMLSFLCMIFYMTTLRSFGRSYITPVSPPVWNELLPALLRKPFVKNKTRPAELNTTDSTRQGEGQ
ncbi:spore germination protein [Paenibacillus sp. GCM10023252]|uniref:spore germination protein n=1 Tax=Paenibacillus sp. GCM10023252 TaxID=3252649 RepID=UPI00361C7890